MSSVSSSECLEDRESYNSHGLERVTSLYSQSSSTSEEVPRSRRASTLGVTTIAKTSSADSRASINGPESLKLSLKRTITKIVDAVKDDNEQTDKDSSDLNKVLESRFDVEDAIRLVNNRSSGRLPVRQSFDEEVSAQSWHGDTPTRGNKDLDDDSDRQTVEKVFTNKSTGDLELPPDGGYGWVVTFCMCVVMFSTWGCNSGFGVFLAFYLNEEVFPGATKYDYALIAGLTVALGQGCSPFVMVIMRIIGIKSTMLFGTALMLAGFILASFATQLWQLYLTQGVMSGASISFIFVPATTMIPGWFLKRRAVAMGLSMMGTGAGGVVYGLAANKMISQDGNTKTALRVLAITCTVSVLVAIVFLKQRNPVPSVGLRSWKLIVSQFKQIFDIRVVRNPFVSLVALWCSLALLGYSLMVFTLSSYAIARGMTAHEGSILTAVLNAAQAIGRPLMGLAGDKFGRANVTIVLTFFLTVLLFAFWIPAHTFVQLLMFSICVGSCVGVANVMNTVLIADNVPPHQFLTSWSFVNLSSSPPLLVCELVAQALTVPGDKDNPYLHTQIFAGSCFCAALILVLILREYAIRLKLIERQKATDLELEEWKLDGEHDPSNELDSDRDLEEVLATLNERKIKYDLLLGSGIKKYLLRMAYPMKV
ncbi:hypothetical protein HG536_0D03070 [Torulaspora globosa]|uniref:Major facilitator superfamily (MFS) profile domain-containing protein n=1 Tax=Torulaspora globosa TaxID=48254 RepID=A0A7G3ZGZ9_9SACH|nr:uncharacterized protein HG536_0D03070 [Torulaspora globosa]QLL32785.1 hypothetical protein HG536_0D03070 [Torulaspora globosa]